MRVFQFEPPPKVSSDAACIRFLGDVASALSEVDGARIGVVASASVDMRKPWLRERTGLTRWPGTTRYEHDPGIALWTISASALGQEAIEAVAARVIPSSTHGLDAFGFYRVGDRAFDVGWYVGHERFGRLGVRAVPRALALRSERILKKWSNVALLKSQRLGPRGPLWR